MKPAIALLLLLSGASWIAAAQAQTMYRCGKTYQDRPCAAGQAGKAMGSAVSSSAPAAGAAGADAECVQKGKDSLKIVWSREGGATEERLLGEAHSEAQRRFIRDVYRRPGAASTVQAAVEADCVVAKAQAEQDAAIALAAALKAQREGKLASPPAGYGDAAAASAAPDPALEERRKAEQLAAAAKRRCDGLGSELDRLRADERRGGSAQTMERLAERRRELHAQMGKAGC
jgi:hypothetical protein